MVDDEFVVDTGNVGSESNTSSDGKSKGGNGANGDVTLPIPHYHNRAAPSEIRIPDSSPENDAGLNPNPKPNAKGKDEGHCSPVFIPQVSDQIKRPPPLIIDGGFSPTAEADMDAVDAGGVAGEIGAFMAETREQREARV